MRLADRPICGWNKAGGPEGAGPTAFSTWGFRELTAGAELSKRRMG